MNYRTLWIVLWTIFSLSLVSQAWQLYRFVNQGARFTAEDGQELCRRIQALEAVSYGYRDAGRKPVDCNYQKGVQ